MAIFPSSMLLAAIFFVSLSTLAFEVLLTRVFSISQWNHLSFMVISIALFGFGASGTFLSIIDIRRKQRQASPPSRLLLGALLCFYSAATTASFLSLNHIPLDYFRLPVEPLQSLYLLAAYLLLALPFFFSGLIISIGYTAIPEKTGLVYFASMSGSALGAIAPVPLLPFIAEGRLIIISTLIPLIPTVFSMLNPASNNDSKIPGRLFFQKALMAINLGIICLAIFLLSPTGRDLIEVKPSPYKAISQVLQFPKTRIIETANGIRGRIEQVQTPYVRFAPGLSLKYKDSLPRQQAIYTDGDKQVVLYDLKEKNAARFATYMLSYAGYLRTGRPENVLLIESGGGSAIACAIASGANRISIVEQNPDIADIFHRWYRLPVITRNSRVFLAQSRERYDIIQIENWGASIPGAAALDQAHLFTIEAFAEYWEHLTASGTVIVSRKLLLPPSDSLRLWSTAYEVLKKQAVKRPEAHLALLRNFDTFTLLVSKSRIDNRRIFEFCEQKNFDLVFLDEIQKDMVNRFNVFEKPYHYQETNQLAAAYQSGRQAHYFDTYLLDVAPQPDRRPFPGRFLKWPKATSLYRSLGSRFYVLLMSGEVVISLLFVEALTVASCLLVIPLVLVTRKFQKPSAAQVLFFLGVGAGFMSVEIYFIKCFILIVGDPVISFTLVVATILVFTSMGGLWMQKKSRWNIRRAMAVLIGVLILTAAGFEILAADILKAPKMMRYLTMIIFLFPLGFLMGLPFPLGMRYLLNSPVQRAYAWSVNGCASVLSSIIAAQVAISFGIPFIAAGAVFCYFLALVAVGKESQN